LRDIARSLDRNVSRSWTLILIPNALCIAGAFTMGFGVMASVITNNVAALAALANGMLPLRRIAQVQLEAESKHELRRMYQGAEAEARQVIDAEFVVSADLTQAHVAAEAPSESLEPAECRALACV